MKHNADDRRNNVNRIQKNIDMTIHNIELAEELMSKTSDESIKQRLKAKNKRRAQALEGMRKEIQDEAADRTKGYQR